MEDFFNTLNESARYRANVFLELKNGIQSEICKTYTSSQLIEMLKVPDKQKGRFRKYPDKVPLEVVVTYCNFKISQKVEANKERFEKNLKESKKYVAERRRKDADNFFFIKKRILKKIIF